MCTFDNIHSIFLGVMNLNIVVSIPPLAYLHCVICNFNNKLIPVLVLCSFDNTYFFPYFLMFNLDLDCEYTISIWETQVHSRSSK